MCVKVEYKQVKVRYPSMNFIKEFGFNFKSREEGGMLTYFYLCSVNLQFRILSHILRQSL